MDDWMTRYAKLLLKLCEYDSLAVAFSGGVDSALLLRAARDALGANCAAITARASWCPRREGEEAAAFCKSLGVRQIVVDVKAEEIEGFRDNPPERCYLCKKVLLGKLKERALEEGFAALAEGSNLDDEGDYRPGLRAVAELGVVSPLREAGLHKAEIRELSRFLELPTWDKPSMACLASRFAYGERITEEKLQRVEIAEELLRAAGFRQLRVRLHGDLARIELPPAELGKLLPLRESISRDFRNLGFRYVTLDLEGYRTGSMNEVLVDGK